MGNPLTKLGRMVVRDGRVVTIEAGESGKNCSCCGKTEGCGLYIVVQACTDPAPPDGSPLCAVCPKEPVMVLVHWDVRISDEPGDALLYRTGFAQSLMASTCPEYANYASAAPLDSYLLIDSFGSTEYNCFEVVGFVLLATRDGEGINTNLPGGAACWNLRDNGDEFECDNDDYWYTLPRINSPLTLPVGPLREDGPCFQSPPCRNSLREEPKYYPSCLCDDQSPGPYFCEGTLPPAAGTRVIVGEYCVDRTSPVLAGDVPEGASVICVPVAPELVIWGCRRRVASDCCVTQSRFTRQRRVGEDCFGYDPLNPNEVTHQGCCWETLPKLTINWTRVYQENRPEGILKETQTGSLTFVSLVPDGFGGFLARHKWTYFRRLEQEGFADQVLEQEDFIDLNTGDFSCGCINNQVLDLLDAANNVVGAWAAATGNSPGGANVFNPDGYGSTTTRTTCTIEPMLYRFGAALSWSEANPTIGGIVIGYPVSMSFNGQYSMEAAGNARETPNGCCDVLAAGSPIPQQPVPFGMAWVINTVSGWVCKRCPSGT
jgi:hypothetical protein